MAERVVILDPNADSIWLLSGVRRDAAGRISSAWVENGAWAITFDWEARVGRARYSDGAVASTWPLEGDLREVAVPDGLPGDLPGEYAAVMAWAELQEDT